MVKFFIFYIIISSLSTVYAIKDEVNFYVDGEHGCFRLLNGTHQFGCGNGNRGTLLYHQDLNILNSILKKYSSHKFLILCELTQVDIFFTLTENFTNVEGFLLYNNLTLPNESFSPDNPIPNEISNLYTSDSSCLNCRETPWNSYGKALFYKNYQGHPIIYVKDNANVERLKQCFLKYNQDFAFLNFSTSSITNSRAICAIQIDFLMHAAGDSQICLRRSQLDSLSSSTYCQELGDKNVWTLLRPTTKQSPNQPQSIIAIVARMDSLTMFDGISPASESSALAIITLLSIAETLHTWQLQNNFKIPTDKNCLFVLFNGEAYDYIGSSSLLYHMNNLSAFPAPIISGGKDGENISIPKQHALINTSHISHLIELGQLGLPTKMGIDEEVQASLFENQPVYWIHSDPVSRQTHQTTKLRIIDLIEKIKNMSTTVDNNTSIAFESVWDYTKNDTNELQSELPPSSLYTFLKADRTIPAIYIGDHKAEYHNKYGAKSHLNLFALNPKLKNGIFIASLGRINNYSAKGEKHVKLFFIADRFYHSPLDDYNYLVSNYHQNSNAKKYSPRDRKKNEDKIAQNLQQISTVISKVLAKMLVEKVDDVDNPSKIDMIEAKISTISALMECYLRNSSCLFWSNFRAYVNIRSSDVLPRYVSVVDHIQLYTILTHLSLAFLTANYSIIDTTNETKFISNDSTKKGDEDMATKMMDFETCKSLNQKTDEIYSYYWIPNKGDDSHPNHTQNLGQNNQSPGVCFKSMVQFSLARSPAFLIPNYDVKRNALHLSTWTESVWDKLTIKFYLEPSISTDRLIFGIAVIMCLITQCLISYVGRYGHILFPTVMMNNSLNSISNDINNLPVDNPLNNDSNGTNANARNNVDINDFLPNAMTPVEGISSHSVIS